MSRKLAGAAFLVGFSGFIGAAHAADTARAGDNSVSLDLGGTALELRRIPKGTFTQGSAATEPGREVEELQRSVTITRSFWLGKVPVTRAQFARFVTETRHLTDAEKSASGGFGWDGKTLTQKKEYTWRNPGFAQKEEDPVVLVTFGDASAFTAWASRKTGKRVRLPTEAEWEYGARAGTTTPWYGAAREDEVATLGWVKTNALWRTQPTAQKKPNAFGLYDMAGNVQEWCRDVYGPYTPGDVSDPEATTNTSTEPERRVLRGGSWLRDAKRARSAARGRAAPGHRSAENGFRVAVDEDLIAPAAAAIPSGDFAVASPVALGSSSVPVAGADAGAAAAIATPARSSSEGTPWALLAAPLASAAAAVAWVLARRGARARLREANEEGPTRQPGMHLPTPLPMFDRAPSEMYPVAPRHPFPNERESVRLVATAPPSSSQPSPSPSPSPAIDPLPSAPSIEVLPSVPLLDVLSLRAIEAMPLAMPDPPPAIEPEEIEPEPEEAIEPEPAKAPALPEPSAPAAKESSPALPRTASEPFPLAVSEPPPPVRARESEPKPPPPPPPPTGPQLPPAMSEPAAMSESPPPPAASEPKPAAVSEPIAAPPVTGPQLPESKEEAGSDKNEASPPEEPATSEPEKASE